MVNEDGCGLHQYGNQCNRSGSCSNTMGTAVVAQEDDDCRDVDEVFGHNDGCTHVHFEKWVFNASRAVQREPGWVYERTAAGRQRRSGLRTVIIHLACCPAMISCEWGIVQAPVLQVVKVPDGHWKVIGDLHPMPLSFEIAMHRLFPKTWHLCQACSL